MVNAADPDGPEPVDDQLQQDRRYLELKQRRDGMWHLAGRLSNTLGAQLNAILDPLTKPRSTAIEDEDGTVVEIPDQRPQVQRLHDALEEACARLLKAADQPSVGGIPASVIVTISLEDLLAKAGLAETADGSQLTSDQLLRIADEADIWPTIIDQNGVPLALGRSRRLASPGQTMALIARDAGCSFPGCTHPPQWCDRHHILDWILGGPTDLDNLTLLCRYHHTHFLQKGWTCRINCRRATRMDPTPMDRPRSTTPHQRPHPTPQHPTPVGPARPTTNTRSGMRSFDQLVLSQPLSSLVNSQVFGRGVPSTAVIGTAPLRLLVQKAPRDCKRSCSEQRRIITGVRCSSSRSMTSRRVIPGSTCSSSGGVHHDPC